MTTYSEVPSTQGKHMGCLRQWINCPYELYSLDLVLLIQVPLSHSSRFLMELLKPPCSRAHIIPLVKPLRTWSPACLHDIFPYGSLFLVPSWSTVSQVTYLLELKLCAGHGHWSALGSSGEDRQVPAIADRACLLQPGKP